MNTIARDVVPLTIPILVGVIHVKKSEPNGQIPRQNIQITGIRPAEGSIVRESLAVAGDSKNFTEYIRAEQKYRNQKMEYNGMRVFLQ